jgi:hypothetical protein
MTGSPQGFSEPRWGFSELLRRIYYSNSAAGGAPLPCSPADFRGILCFTDTSNLWRTFMNKTYFSCFIAAALIVAPLTARAAEDFCPALNKIIADAPNSFKGVAKGSPGAAPVPASVVLPGFPENMVAGDTSDATKSCKVSGTPVMYVCTSMTAPSIDVAGETKKCLKDWTPTETNVQGMANTLTLTKDKTVVSLVSSTTPATTTLTVMAQPGQ